MSNKKTKVIILTQRIKCDPKVIDDLKEEIKSKGYEAIVLPYGIEKTYENNV